jgi:hypothetical protein
VTHDQLFTLMRSAPFRPYRLKTAGGRDVAITHPEAIAYGGERTVLVVLPGDRWEILDIDLIESVEGTNEPTPSIDRSDEDEEGEED